jgi:hypothetical protein
MPQLFHDSGKPDVPGEGSKYFPLLEHFFLTTVTWMAQLGLNPGSFRVVGALNDNTLWPLSFCSFQEVTSIKGPEVMTRGKHNQWQDAEKPV